MEESLDIFENIRRGMELDEVDVSGYSPLALAYIGDAVYEMAIRTMVVSAANTQVKKMHQKSSSLVKAQAQAEIIRLLFEELEEQEINIYKRGRNAKSYTKAKNATVIDYRMATGFEALIGYLYLSHQTNRMLTLIHEGVERLEKNE